MANSASFTSKTGFATLDDGGDLNGALEFTRGEINISAKDSLGLCGQKGYKLLKCCNFAN